MLNRKWREKGLFINMGEILYMWSLDRIGDEQMMKRADKIEDMIKVFEPFPLEESAFDTFYVNTYEARGTNPVKRMAYGLEYSSNPNMKILFMGHRGSGKSTELYLLKQEIKNKFDVIDFFIEDEVDVDSMTSIDFIFAIMAQIVKFIEKHEDIDLVEEDINALYKYWQEEKIIEQTHYDFSETDAGFRAKLSLLKKIVVEAGGILKTGSEARTTVRKKIEHKVNYLIQLLNQIIGKIEKQIHNKGLIFIVEDLDKLSMEATNRLFIKERRNILAIKSRMILTFPVFMAYDVQYNMIKEEVDM